MEDKSKELVRYESAAATVKALQTSKLLNPDKSLREIVDVASKIPGLGEGNPAGWELITRDYVYKGIVGPELGDGDAGGGLRAALKPVSERDIQILKDSGTINFDIKLSEILEMSSRVPDIRAGGNPVAWELISRDFVLRG